MKLSKAKKLFKAGEIQICNDVSDNQTYTDITEWGTDYRGYWFHYVWKHSPSGQTRQKNPFDHIKIVNLSDIKPSKKKTLKKRVKMLEYHFMRLSEEFAELNPGGFQAAEVREFRAMLRATTEPKQ